MAWYAYCLTEHQALPNGTRARRPFLLEGIQGVSGAPVLSYPSGDFAVVVSEYDRATHKVDEKTVLEHARVVSVCFRNGTVLPFRFGTIFDSDDALRQAVRSNRRAFGVSVEKLNLAGAFGNYIRQESARTIGLLPEDLPVDPVGNSALRGARMLLLTPSTRQARLRRIAALSQHVELAANPDFEFLYAGMMALARYRLHS